MSKRLFDIVVSIIGIVILSPLLISLGVAVKLGSPGPIIYRASRVGRFGISLKLLKFRSMVVNADKIGPAVTSAFDPRVTRIGHFLRVTKFDELPQLFNVLRGEMSIVGPRPEHPYYVAMYNDEQRKILDVRPGITSPASLIYRYEEMMLNTVDWEIAYIEQVMPAKLAIDMAYAQQSDVWKDFKIIFRTLLRLPLH